MLVDVKIETESVPQFYNLPEVGEISNTMDFMFTNLLTTNKIVAKF